MEGDMRMNNETLEFDNLTAVYETRHSTKKDSDYSALFLRIGDNYEKIVFLSQAELEILKATYHN